MKMAIVYGSSLGNTAEVAKMIKKEFNMPNNIDVYDVNDVAPEILNKYDKFIFGTST